MTSIDRKLLASFILQRMEMGETDWFFKPETDFSQNTDKAGNPPHSNHVILTNKTTDNTGKIMQMQTPENVCSGTGVDEGIITDQENLNDLYNAVCGCTRCPLGKTRIKFVFGDGNPHADVMFVGEAPGADEDAQGIPFVGRAGQLLTKMIEAIKLTREEVFIGNILKCRPPGNRDPKPDEIECCEPILVRQIELIQPTIICALGRIAGQTLLRSKSSLGALRGKIHDYHGVKLMVTYHPAALLRNPNWKPHAWDDLKFLRREYDGMVIS